MYTNRVKMATLPMLAWRQLLAFYNPSNMRKERFTK